MSNRNFDASSITRRLGNKAVAKSILTQNQSANPYFFQPQTSNFNASVMNEVESGNQLYVTRGDTCVTLDPGCPCPGAITAVLEPTCSGIKTPLSSYANLGAVQWATFIPGGTAIPANISDIATDSQGNVYVTGSTGATGAIIFVRNVNGATQTNSPFGLPAKTIEYPFLIKYNSAGICQWATCISDITNSGLNYSHALSIAIDSNDNVYMTGTYIATLTVDLEDAVLGPAPPTPSQTTSSYTLPESSQIQPGDFATFLVKYNTSGVVQWGTIIDGTAGSASNTEAGKSISIDSFNNVHLTGIYVSSSSINLQSASGTGQTNSGIFLPSSAGANASYLVKYNSSGVVQWATNQVGIITSSTNSIICDNCDNVYVAGFYTTSTAFFLQNASGTGQSASTTVQLPGTNVKTAYLAKYDINGTAQWATYLVGTPATTDNEAFGVCVDYNNDVYVTGTYTSSGIVPVINGSTLLASGITLEATLGNKANSVFLIKYTPTGVAQWATFLGKTGASGRAVTVDGLNNIYVSGQFTLLDNPTLTYIQNATTTGQTQSGIALPSTTTVPPEPSNQGGFVVKYNTNGIGQFAAYINTASFSDISYAIHIDPLDNRLYMGGIYSNSPLVTPITLDNATTTTVYSSSGVTLPTSTWKGFLIKYA